MAMAEQATGMVSNFFKRQPSGVRGFVKGAGAGYNLGFKGNLPFFIAFGAYAAATAPRGQKISAVSGGGIGWGATAIVGGAIAGAVGLPPQVGAFVAGMVFGNTVDEAISRTVQSAVDFGSNMRRMRFGGDYRDSQTAITMRQVASREMSRSLMNARQWLGQEGAFMHQ